jgi:hypothetical protein
MPSEPEPRDLEVGQSIEKRVHALLRWRVYVPLSALALCNLLCLVGFLPLTTLRVHRLVVVDSALRERALTEPSNGAGALFLMRDASGRLQFALSTDADGTKARFYDHLGHGRVAIGVARTFDGNLQSAEFPELRMEDADGKPRVSLAVSQVQAPWTVSALALLDDSGRTALGLSAADNASDRHDAGLGLLVPTKSPKALPLVMLQAASGESGPGSWGANLAFRDSSGATRLGLSLDETQASAVGLDDAARIRIGSVKSDAQQGRHPSR